MILYKFNYKMNIDCGDPYLFNKYSSGFGITFE
jgi:hypothetical protein